MIRTLTTRFALGCWLVLALSSAALADGGALRALERSGGLQIAVFTSPNPLIGPDVDISVLVQDEATLQPVSQAAVQVTLTPHERPYAALTLAATSEAATNKLLRDCRLALEGGVYEVEVSCTAGNRSGRARFVMQVAPPPAQLARMWPWFAWPAVPILLFGVHQHLSRKRPSPGQLCRNIPPR